MSQSPCTVLVYEFDAATTVAEVSSYFSQFVALTNCTLHQGVFMLELADSNELLKLLSATHVHEESKLSFRFNIPTTSEKKSKTLEFAIECPFDDEVNAKAQIETATRSFTTISCVKYEPGQVFGYIRCKKSLATDVIKSIVHQGGISIQDEILHLRPLSCTFNHNSSKRRRHLECVHAAENFSFPVKGITELR